MNFRHPGTAQGDSGPIQTQSCQDGTGVPFYEWHRVLEKNADFAVTDRFL